MGGRLQGSGKEYIKKGSAAACDYVVHNATGVAYSLDCSPLSIREYRRGALYLKFIDQLITIEQLN